MLNDVAATTYASSVARRPACVLSSLTTSKFDGATCATGLAVVLRALFWPARYAASKRAPRNPGAGEQRPHRQ
jgi:hypothetical protein